MTAAKGKGQKAESDVKRQMREALEAKKAKAEAAHGEDHLGGRTVGPGDGAHGQRMFRRKSGG